MKYKKIIINEMKALRRKERRLLRMKIEKQKYRKMKIFLIIQKLQKNRKNI